jgi:hypothetical protein
VKNAYGREASETIPLERPAPREGALQAPRAPVAPRGAVQGGAE